MRVEPEQMLKEHWIAADSGIKNSDVGEPLKRKQQYRDCNNWCAKHHDQAGGIMGPDKQRQPKPGHPWSTHRMDGDDKVQSGQDRRKAVDENAEAGSDHVGVGKGRAKGRIEGPARIDASYKQRIDRDHSADDVNVPAQKVDPGKSKILRADHHRYEKVPERSRYRRNQKEKHHYDTVLREGLIVGGRLKQIPLRSQKLETDQHRVDSADQKEEGDRNEI